MVVVRATWSAKAVETWFVRAATAWSAGTVVREREVEEIQELGGVLETWTVAVACVPCVRLRLFEFEN